MNYIHILAFFQPKAESSMVRVPRKSVIQALARLEPASLLEGHDPESVLYDPYGWVIHGFREQLNQESIMGWTRVNKLKCNAD